MVSFLLNLLYKKLGEGRESWQTYRQDSLWESAPPFSKLVPGIKLRSSGLGAGRHLYQWSHSIAHKCGLSTILTWDLLSYMLFIHKVIAAKIIWKSCKHYPVTEAPGIGNDQGRTRECLTVHKMQPERGE